MLAAALVALAAGACGGSGSAPATSADPCAQIADDAVTAWNDYKAKHGADLQNLPEDAKADMTALQEKVGQLETAIRENGCKADDVGRRIQEQAPDFLGIDKQSQ